jgi:hypothetical protein
MAEHVRPEEPQQPRERESDGKDEHPRPQDTPPKNVDGKTWEDVLEEDRFQSTDN